MTRPWHDHADTCPKVKELRDKLFHGQAKKNFSEKEAEEKFFELRTLEKVFYDFCSLGSCQNNCKDRVEERKRYLNSFNERSK